MGNFIAYLLSRRPLLEVSELFPRSMNALFQREIDEVMPQVTDPEIRNDLVRLYHMDFIGYMDKSLRSAGVAFSDLDPLVHDLVVKLLVSPGGLVSRWKRDAPLSFRFKRAVKNAITTLAERAAKRRRRVGEMPDQPFAVERPRDNDDLIADFRQWLGAQHGTPAVVVFDARLEGRDIKDLIGTAVGIPTAYALKKITKQIKASAVTWAGSDLGFQEKVRRLVDAEQATFAKRLASAAGRSPS